VLPFELLSLELFLKVLLASLFLSYKLLLEIILCRKKPKIQQLTQIIPEFSTILQSPTKSRIGLFRLID
jgi:hypothetical protein